eukprot:COSAG02_NODE_1471_length_12452_cov_7.724358_6_plen_80_part_00
MSLQPGGPPAASLSSLLLGNWWLKPPAQQALLVLGNEARNAEEAQVRGGRAPGLLLYIYVIIYLYTNIQFDYQRSHEER